MPISSSTECLALRKQLTKNFTRRLPLTDYELQTFGSSIRAARKSAFRANRRQGTKRLKRSETRRNKRLALKAEADAQKLANTA